MSDQSSVDDELEPTILVAIVVGSTGFVLMVLGAIYYLTRWGDVPSRKTVAISSTVTGKSPSSLPMETAESKGDDEAPSSAIVKEELIEIYAPAGKLGVVLEDSVADDGPPLVHNLRDASVLKNALLAGDRIIALDDDDVRNMSASKLSKMISQKRENETRKLSIIRTIPATGVAAEC